MKRIKTIILFLFVLSELKAQTPVQFTPDSDTAYWYRYKQTLSNAFSLGSTGDDHADLSFRFWTDGSLVRVTKKNGVFSGKIIRFVEAYPSKKHQPFKKTYTVSSAAAKQVFKLVDSFNLKALPSYKNIKGWQSGFDGVIYFTEYLENNQYSFKNYWSPAAQGSLTEAQQFQNFVDQLGTILDLAGISTAFQEEIPFDGWRTPGSPGSVLRLTKKKVDDAGKSSLIDLLKDK